MIRLVSFIAVCHCSHWLHLVFFFLFMCPTAIHSNQILGYANEMSVSCESARARAFCFINEVWLLKSYKKCTHAHAFAHTYENKYRNVCRSAKMHERRKEWKKQNLLDFGKYHETNIHEQVENVKMWMRRVEMHWGNCTADAECDLSCLDGFLIGHRYRNYCWLRWCASAGARARRNAFWLGREKANPKKKNVNRTHSIGYLIVWETMQLFAISPNSHQLTHSRF